MKLARLELQRFGRFTDAVLELGADDASASGVHVVFGANEAGKSTTLDAIRYSLYGMPKGGSREPKYDFLHRTNEVRTQLELLLDDGSVLDFVRNRGAKVSVLDPRSGDPDQARADRLAGVLRGVPVELWRTRHGLSQADLRAGSRAMLEGGASADALFAAVNGLGSARRVLGEVQARRRALLNDKGGSGALHDALKELKDATKAFNEARRSTGRYDAAQVEYDGARQAVDEARTEEARLADELDRLTRARQALEQLGARAVLVERRDAITGVAQAWGSAEQERFESARRAVGTAGGEVAKLDAQLATAAATIAEHEVDAALLASADAIGALHQRVGVVTQAQALLGDLRVAARTADARLADALAAVDGLAVDGADAASLEARVAAMPARLVLDALRTTATERAALELALGAAERAAASAREQVEARRRSVTGAAVDIDELRALDAALRVAQGIDEGALVQDEAAIAASRRGLDQRSARVAPGVSTARALAAVPMPTPGSVARLAERIAELADRRSVQLEVIGNARKHLEERSGALAALEASEELLERGALDGLRAERDAAWASVRAAATTVGEQVDGADVVAADQATLAADAYVDRMVLDGERIGAANQMRGEIALDEHRIEAATVALAAIDREQAQVDTAWAELWSPSGFAVGSVDGMREVMAEVADIVGALERADADQAALAGRRARLDSAAGALAAALGSPVAADGFATLVAHAVARQAELQELQSSEREARGALAQLEGAARTAVASVEAARADVESTTDAWLATLVGAGLAPGSNTAVALGVCDRYDAVAEAASAAREARSRVADADALVRGFADDVDRLLASLSEACRAELADADPTAAVALLVARVGQMHTHAKVRGDAVERHAMLAAERAECLARRAGADADLAELVARAGVDDVDALATAAGQWVQQHDLVTQIATLDHELLAVARMTSTEIEAVVDGRDDIELRARVGALRSDLAAATARVASLDADVRARGEAIGALKEQTAQAEARIRQGDARAQLDQLVPEYRRLVLEEQLLQSLMERAAQRERGPLVERASRYLQQLTCGEWRRLVTGLDDAGNAQAQVEHADDGMLVAVESLSEGTRDQLYLALRLAALVDGAARGETMPLVVDDILLTFDNQRAVATLELLAEVSEHMQVVFLTHHEHLVELATAAIDTDVLRLHRLDELTPTTV